MRIDAHQHFWNFDPLRQAWITEEMKNIRRDFGPEDLSAELLKNSIDGCVAVQVAQTELETTALLAFADHHDFIKGVVGWVDLCAAEVSERLDYFSSFPRLKGFRHIVQAERDDAFILKKDFCRGIRLLADRFTYDVLVYPRHLPYVAEFARKFSRQKLVIDHLAKPAIAQHDRKDWTRLIREVAAEENVYCKLSGMVTEANWSRWTYDDLEPYLDVVVEAFGIRRVMYGSDWPVCLVAASYGEQLAPYLRYFGSFSASDQESVFGNNAREFYTLS
jgi:L-fuconolactonase